MSDTPEMPTEQPDPQRSPATVSKQRRPRPAARQEVAAVNQTADQEPPQTATPAEPAKAETKKPAKTVTKKPANIEAKKSAKSAPTKTAPSAAAKTGKTAATKETKKVVSKPAGMSLKPLTKASAGKAVDAPSADTPDTSRQGKPKIKAKLVRDSFTMPQVDFDLIAVLKQRALEFKRPAKKSELLRAGLRALLSLSDTRLRLALDSLMPLKPGRPRKNELA